MDITLIKCQSTVRPSIKFSSNLKTTTKTHTLESVPGTNPYPTMRVEFLAEGNNRSFDGV